MDPARDDAGARALPTFSDLVAESLHDYAGDPIESDNIRGPIPITRSNTFTYQRTVPTVPPANLLPEGHAVLAHGRGPLPRLAAFETEDEANHARAVLREQDARALAMTRLQGRDAPATAEAPTPPRRTPLEEVVMPETHVVVATAAGPEDAQVIHDVVGMLRRTGVLAPSAPLDRRAASAAIGVALRAAAPPPTPPPESPAPPTEGEALAALRAAARATEAVEPPLPPRRDEDQPSWPEPRPWQSRWRMIYDQAHSDSELIQRLQSENEQAIERAAYNARLAARRVETEDGGDRSIVDEPIELPEIESDDSDTTDDEGENDAPRLDQPQPRAPMRVRPAEIPDAATVPSARGFFEASTGYVYPNGSANIGPTFSEPEDPRVGLLERSRASDAIMAEMQRQYVADNPDEETRFQEHLRSGTRNSIVQAMQAHLAQPPPEAEGAVFPTPVDPNGYETIEEAQVANLVSHGMPFEEALAVVQRVGEEESEPPPPAEPAERSLPPPEADAATVQSAGGFFGASRAEQARQGREILRGTRVLTAEERLEHAAHGREMLERLDALQARTERRELELQHAMRHVRAHVDVANLPPLPPESELQALHVVHEGARAFGGYYSRDAIATLDALATGRASAVLDEAARAPLDSVLGPIDKQVRAATEAHGRVCDVLDLCDGVDAPKAWEPPDEFKCPLSLRPMRDPVVAADGYTYERAYIEREVRRPASGRRSPLTREPFASLCFHENRALRARMEAWALEHCEDAVLVYTPGRYCYSTVERGALKMRDDALLEAGAEAMRAFLDKSWPAQNDVLAEAEARRAEPDPGMAHASVQTDPVRGAGAAYRGTLPTRARRPGVARTVSAAVERIERRTRAA